MAMMFDTQTWAEQNIFEFENKLKSAASKFISETGPLFVTYFALNENSSTTDRWLNDIDKYFGREAPLRYNQISNFPLYGFSNNRPDNTDEQQVEDINVDGECIIIPSTIVPHPNDFFSIPHVGSPHLFQVTNVVWDSLRPEGYYQIHYHLITTSEETYQGFLKYQVEKKFQFNMDAVGTDNNPVLSDEDAAASSDITSMIERMAEAYKALFYNERHNCFLYRDERTGWDWFDMCGNEFMATHSIMNTSSYGRVVVLHKKLYDPQFPIKYNNSVWRWLELGADPKYLRKFHFLLGPVTAYPYSSFVQWGDEDVMVIQPLGPGDVKLNSQWLSYWDEEQFNAFLDPSAIPTTEYEKLIHDYIHNKNMGLVTVSKNLADALINSIKHRDIFLYTPMVIYILRQILGNTGSNTNQ